jgi:hypothetical protein
MQKLTLKVRDKVRDKDAKNATQEGPKKEDTVEMYLVYHSEMFSPNAAQPTQGKHLWLTLC